MIRIQQMKLPIGHTAADLERKIIRTLRIAEKQLKDYSIVKQSIDARRKDEVYYVYTIDASMEQEQRVFQAVSKKSDRNSILLTNEESYQIPSPGTVPLKYPPVIVGSGPAGLFCGLLLARAGYAPVIIERGSDVRKRKAAVEEFWRTGTLNPSANVQFGEGGAGTFSDGKLNTLVKDVKGRNRYVLNAFVSFGAPERILYEAKPHIGTDVLIDVVERMRQEIIRLGGRFYFETCLTGFLWEGDHLCGIRVSGVGRKPDIQCNGAMQEPGMRCDGAMQEPGMRCDGAMQEPGMRCDGAMQEPGMRCDGAIQEPGMRCDGVGQERIIPAEAVVLAIGHSARDTFSMLQQEGFPMEAKSFAVGFRVEHPQQMISESQYGPKAAAALSAAPYKVTASLPGGRGVYSFCMCPGGYVVNASSEPGLLAINGMSYSGRDSANANSAIIVSVTPKDFGGTDPLCGVEFQRIIEERAFQLAKGQIPQQLLGDFEAGRVSAGYGDFGSCHKGQAAFAPLHALLPKELTESFLWGMHQFGRRIAGFDRPDCILSGIESRTSSPVRICRNAFFESESSRADLSPYSPRGPHAAKQLISICGSAQKKGVYPCGEGAGYAGGIMSASMDGMKVAEAIISKYKTYVR